MLGCPRVAPIGKPFAKQTKMGWVIVSGVKKVT